MNTCKCGREFAEEKFCPDCGREVGKANAPAGTAKPVDAPNYPKSAVVQMTEKQFEEFGIALTKNVIDALGMTKIDRKHIAVPGLSDEDVDQMSGKQKMVHLIKAIIAGDHLAAKALAEGTDTAGGYLVPTEFRAEVIKGLEKPGTVRSLVRVIPVGRDTGEFPTVAGNVTVSWTAENAAIPASDPTFGQLTWSVNNLTGLNKASRELFADSAVSVGDLLVLLFTEAFAREERNIFITGTGTGQPMGLQNATGLTAAAQAGASLVADDLVDFYHALPSQYRANGVWIMHDSILELVAKLKDTTGRYLLSDSLNVGTPPTIKGRPVIENEFIPTNLGVGSNESLIFFGAPNWYYLFDRESMGVESSTEAGDATGSAFVNHQVWTKVFERLDGNVALGAAWVKATAIK